MPEETKAAEVQITTSAPIKFGLNQLKNATPQIATNIFRGVLYAVAVGAVICNIVTEIPIEVKDAINHYGIEAVALVHGLSRFFGVDVTKIQGDVDGK